MTIISILENLGEIDLQGGTVVDDGDLTILIETFDLPDDRSTVIVTTRGERDSVGSFAILDSEGERHDARLRRPGQYRFDAVKTGPVRFVRPLAGLRPLAIVHRLNRRLPAAAASGDRVIAGNYASSDGRLTTSVVENAEGHVLLTIASSARWDRLALALCRWAVVTESGVSEFHRVITPLALDPEGRAAARYDLGSVVHAEAVDVQPAEMTSLDELTPSLVSESFALGLFGNARRAWEELAAEPLVSKSLRDAIASELAR